MDAKHKDGWHSRGYLPHLEVAGRTQFVTWRLADSVPIEVLEAWTQELESLPSAERRKEMCSRVDRFLDRGMGSNVLKNPVAAGIVQESLLFYHGVRFLLSCWCIMPNHVHALFVPLDGISLEDIMRPLKGYTARAIHLQLGGSGTLWQRESFDVLVRDEEHRHRLQKYIEWNPVKAGLCRDPKHWAWSSANPAALEKLTAKNRELGLG